MSAGGEAEELPADGELATTAEEQPQAAAPVRVREAGILRVDETWVIVDGEGRFLGSVSGEDNGRLILLPCYELLTSEEVGTKETQARGGLKVGQRALLMKAMPYALLGIGCPVHVMAANIAFYRDMQPADQLFIRAIVAEAEGVKNVLRASRAGLVLAK